MFFRDDYGRLAIGVNVAETTQTTGRIQRGYQQIAMPFATLGELNLHGHGPYKIKAGADIANLTAADIETDSDATPADRKERRKRKAIREAANELATERAKINHPELWPA